MKVKKYIAPSMPDAMKKISQELGKDAVILNSKVVYSGGFLGLFRKKNIEVIAAIDPDVKRKKELEKKKENFEKQSKQPEQLITKPQQNNETNKQLINEIQQLKALVKKLSAQNPEAQNIPAPYQKIYERLLQQNIDRHVLQQLTEQCLEHFYKNDEKISDEEAVQFVADTIKNYLNEVSFSPISLQKKYINVVGPTGVGKTTTLAKLAANTVLQHKKNVAFITTDTYRIAAVEQLKTYAKILDVPCEVCYNMLDFKKAVKKYADKDYVFIDTAGRNFRNDQYVKELKSTIDFNHDMESFLVFSLTAKEQDLKAIYEQFSIVPIDQFIFTKLDETSIYGSLFNLPYKYKKGIAYITNGQDVPDDIVEASKEFIINQIIGVDLYE
ncbi:flagellar biosynthesis protein FlhF [Pallidibacillus pasinlerensis]|uniref:Flagellar biosynthesis protein FlhF n=1 Tax=Pallidibacillus pasinlerensis TaxID=2703818 RepID=A0ABX0A3F8_9BACI|nr:flagellar biosynthesis protein FlhF [Pallidibacillus pasinlerensis]NCU16514.1 flagellar biosynthesis protein FlhF [Pallidibacillus pasinlerensis]